jgi:energy-coupling factor transporter ATP-binding protein EcfA2
MSSSKAINRYAGELAKTNWGDALSNISKALYTATAGLFQELLYGLKARTIPWNLCFVAGTIIAVCISKHWDAALLTRLHLSWFYPSKRWSFWAYRAFFLVSPWIAWGLWQLVLRQRMLTKLTEACLNAGLKTPMDRLPGFISDRALDEETRKLKLYGAGLPLDRFLGARKVLESTLQIYIDEMREHRGRGTIEVIYAHRPMPDSVELKDIRTSGSWKFTVGRTRSQDVKVDLRKVPHLLVAGQTGGGKSTFLRQFITTLYLNNPSAHFLLIDLKGGLEFQLFEKLKRAEVMPDIKEAIHALSALEEELEQRMKILRESNSKDLEAYYAKAKKKKEESNETEAPKPLSRHIIVIDEAAEMFLAGSHASSSDIQNSKKVLSRIARQGRSVGVHLVVATQRPDSRALDPQVKANLTGVLCFQMQNDASSMTVLGTGRATDLAPLPGRAIWKVGGEMIEVQTPFLGAPTTEAHLEEERRRELE